MSGASSGRPAPFAAAGVLAAFAFVTVFFVNLFPPRSASEFSPSPNEFSRYELVVSMAEHRTFSIDRALAEFGDFEDKAVFGGHAYSNKAPGLSFAALPVYLALRPVLGPARPGRATAMFYALRLCTVSLATLLALAVLAGRLRRSGTDPAFAPAVVFALAFGTPLLVYARSFFSHAWTASLLYLAFELLHRRKERGVHVVLAGFLAGWAVLSEYPAAILVAVLFLDAAWKAPRRGLLFLAGGAPAAALLGWYDQSCFGGIFELSSRHEAFAEYTALSRQELFGFRVPSLSTAGRYLFSRSRGMLVESPFWAFLPVAALSRRLSVRERAVSLAAAAALFVAMCGYENWHGGWAIGSRYLVPGILLAGWVLAGAGELPWPALSRGLFCAAAFFAAAFFFFSGATFWFLPPVPADGLRFYSAFWLSRGWAAPTLLGSSLPALLLPAAATAAAGLLAFRSAMGEAGRSVLVAAAGLLAFALLFLGPRPRGRFEDRLTRAMLFESFTDLDPARAELVRLVPEARTPRDRAILGRVLRHYRLPF
jgi:hypothetical protein